MSAEQQTTSCGKGFTERLESRLIEIIEMKERRKRLLQNIYLREKNLDTNLPKILEPGQVDSGNQDYSADF